MSATPPVLEERKPNSSQEENEMKDLSFGSEGVDTLPPENQNIISRVCLIWNVDAQTTRSS